MRLNMVHGITKQGPLVAVDENGVPILEGWFKPMADGKNKQGKGAMGTETTAKMLWQAKLPLGDYHTTRTDASFHGVAQETALSRLSKLF